MKRLADLKKKSRRLWKWINPTQSSILSTSPPISPHQTQAIIDSAVHLTLSIGYKRVGIKVRAINWKWSQLVDRIKMQSQYLNSHNEEFL
jgi:hypothetical protein